MSKSILVVICLSLIVAGPAWATPEPDVPALPTEPTAIGQAIVGFAPGAMPALAPGDTYLGHEVLKVRPDAPFAVLAADDLAPLRLLAVGDDRVDYLEDDALLRSHFVPDDPRYGNQYGPPMMGFESAWDLLLGTTDVTVAVLDTGIRRSHEDFDSARVLQGHDYNNNDNDPADDCGHGTHVAGTVAATTNNGKGVAGMSQATILPMKVLSPGLVSCSGSISDISAAIRDSADQGAHIISMSLGGGGSSSTMRSAVDHAWDNGVLVVASAGNDNGGSVGYPAAYDNAIAVSAVGSSGQIASYSSVGPQVEVAAPGSSIISTYNSGDSSYSSLSGTSMAAPHVSGALALALSWAPDTSATDLRQILHATAEDAGSPGFDDQYGHGIARIDGMLDSLVPGAFGPSNHVPTLRVTYTVDGLSATFDATETSDANGDDVSITWDHGDGHAHGGDTFTVTAAQPGDVSINVSASDGNGGVTSLVAIAEIPEPPVYPDPDPSVPALQKDETVTFDIAAGEEVFYKVLVDKDSTWMQGATDGPGCLLGRVCQADVDLQIRAGAKPTDTEYDCRSLRTGSDEECTVPEPHNGWWFLRVNATSGAAELGLKANFDGGRVEVHELANAAPRARFAWELQGLQVAFDAAASDDPDEDPLGYSWTIDGAVYTSRQVLHTFPAVGNHSARLEVDDGNGGTSTIEGIVEVTGAGDVDNELPVAVYTVSTTDLIVSVDATGSHDPDGVIESTQWDFGDGSTSSAATTTHSYSAAGDYTVTLTLIDDQGGVTEVTETVQAAYPTDPDPDVPTIEPDQETTFQLDGLEAAHHKVYVVPGIDILSVAFDGPGCTLGVICSADMDLQVRQGARASDTAWDCALDSNNARGTCNVSDPAPGWWFIRVVSRDNGGEVDLVAHLYT